MKKTPHLFIEPSANVPDAIDIGIQTKFNKIHRMVTVSNAMWDQTKKGNQTFFKKIVEACRAGWEMTKMYYPHLMEE